MAPIRPRRSASKLPPDNPGKRRRHLGMDVDQFVAALSDDSRPMVERLRTMVKQVVPEVNEAIRWGMPVFSHHGLLCYISPRPTYVALGFYEYGHLLDDPKGLLEGNGQGRIIKFRSEAELQPKRLAGWIRQAARINAQS